jgi:uncharacterized membrane protein YphA (DoxX/SURF4 family)
MRHNPYAFGVLIILLVAYFIVIWFWPWRRR